MKLFVAASVDVTAAAVVKLVVVTVVELIPVTVVVLLIAAAVVKFLAVVELVAAVEVATVGEGVFAVKPIACAVVDLKTPARLEAVVSAAVDMAQLNAAAVKLTVPAAATVAL